MISKEELYKNKEIYKKESIDFILQVLGNMITSAFRDNKDFVEVKKDIFSYPEETLKIIKDKGYVVKEKEIVVRRGSENCSVVGSEIGYEISWPEEIRMMSMPGIEVPNSDFMTKYYIEKSILEMKKSLKEDRERREMKKTEKGDEIDNLVNEMKETGVVIEEHKDVNIVDILCDKIKKMENPEIELIYVNTLHFYYQQVSSYMNKGLSSF